MDQGERKTSGQALMAHACNFSYSADRDQEDGGSKSAPDKQLESPYLENNSSLNSAGRVA
jgi:hypothetical protein